MELLILVAETGGPMMFARIGVMRALHAGQPEAPPEPKRKRAKKYRIVRWPEAGKPRSRKVRCVPPIAVRKGPAQQVSVGPLSDSCSAANCVFAVGTRVTARPPPCCDLAGEACSCRLGDYKNCCQGAIITELDQALFRYLPSPS
jgi:hypothetical protein